ncbi:MAG: hypothetical protein K6C94_00900 [Candidatus Gastranaerophilales bacterium]|nr:hypothetical protein [Candidatus Gastranaerophilales bacterium]
MNKFLIFAILFIFVISTVLVCIFQPKTHKPIKFENNKFKISMMTDKTEYDNEAQKVEFASPDVNLTTPDFKIEFPDVNIETPNVNIETPKVNIETPKVNVSSPKVDVKTTEKKPQADKSQPAKAEKPQPAKADKTEKKPASKQDKSNDDFYNKKPQTNPNTQVTTPLEDFFNNKPEKKNENKPQVAADNPQPVATKPVTKVLTEEEEIIAWNKWRSDLQNKLMKDSDQKISAPIGTTFYFTFTADVHGNVSNVKTWASNPSYTPEAVRVLKPLIIGYQHKYILQFPEGSKRIITNVSGGFTMAHATTYSSPSDYNDFERVKR